MSKKYTDEELLNELRRFYKENGRVPVYRDFKGNKEYPSAALYQMRFKSWNNGLKLAELPINMIYNRVTPGNYCEQCGSNKTDCWRFLNGKMVCVNCAMQSRKFINGILDPNCTSGFGSIAEHVVNNVLKDAIICNNNISFHAKYDLISKKYGTINVKASTLIKNSNANTYKWNFNIKSVETTPNYYFYIGFSCERLYINKVWIIPSNSKIIKKSGISITNSKIGLKRAQQYEVDPTPYNEVYQNLDIYSLPEFRNLNKTEEVSA